MNNNNNIEIPAFLRKENLTEKKQLEIYENAKKNSTKKRKIKKQKLVKKIVKTTLIAILSYLLGILSVLGVKQVKGSEIIANKFFSYTEGYGINDSSMGYIAVSGGKQISLDSAMTDIINDARYDGMTDIEINIGISKVYGKDLAEKYIGNFSTDEKTKAKFNAYYESMIENYNKNSGGITK